MAIRGVLIPFSASAVIAVATACPAQFINAPAGDSGRTQAVAAARGEVNRARSQLQSAVAKVRTTWKSNPQYIEAMDKVTAARKDLNAARAAVVEKLKTSDPTYAKLLKTQGNVTEKLKAEQEKTNAAASPTTEPARPGDVVKNMPGPSDAQVAVAQEKLDNKAKIRNIEDKAVADDPDAKKAQDKLNEAEKEAKVWRAQLDAALQNDADYKAAHDQLTSARSRLVAAGATADDYDNYGEVIYAR